jgi:transposase
MKRLEHRMHRNVAIVAAANKLARIAWAVLAKGETYHWPPVCCADQVEQGAAG